MATFTFPHGTLVVPKCFSIRARACLSAAIASCDEMGLVILKTIGPWHVGVLDVDDPSICRLLWCDRKVIGSEVWKCIRSVAKLRQRVMNAVEAEVMTALERFNVFGCHFVHPPGDLSAMLADEGIDSSGEGVEDRVDLPIDFVLPLHDALQGAK